LSEESSGDHFKHVPKWDPTGGKLLKISSRGEYALRALIVLGQYDQEVLPIGAIAERTSVPVHYLEQILLQLKLLGFVKSKRGLQGGYSLRLAADQIVIGEVIRKLEGPLAPMHCVSVTAYEPCSLEPVCLLKPLWALIRDTVADLLDTTSLADLLTGTISVNRRRDELAERL
jgi:Rrf2 family protein